MKKRELKKQILKLTGINRIDSLRTGCIHHSEVMKYEVKKSWLNNTKKLRVIFDDLKHNGYDYVPF